MSQWALTPCLFLNLLVTAEEKLSVLALLFPWELGAEESRYIVYGVLGESVLILKLGKKKKIPPFCPNLNKLLLKVLNTDQDEILIRTIT